MVISIIPEDNEWNRITERKLDEETIQKLKKLQPPPVYTQRKIMSEEDKKYVIEKTKMFGDMLLLEWEKSLENRIIVEIDFTNEKYAEELSSNVSFYLMDRGFKEIQSRVIGSKKHKYVISFNIYDPRNSEIEKNDLPNVKAKIIRLLTEIKKRNQDLEDYSYALIQQWLSNGQNVVDAPNFDSKFCETLCWKVKEKYSRFKCQYKKDSHKFVLSLY